MRVAALQLSSTDDPTENLVETLSMIDQAVQGDATFIATPEVTNIISGSRTHQRAVLHTQADDPTLAAIQSAAREHNVWILIGSLALLTEDPDGRFANRSF